MRPYIVRQGDYLTKIAHRFGLEAAAVWSHSANADLRARRADPEQLYPGDVLQLPETSSSSLSVAAGGAVHARAHLPSVEIKLALRGRDGAPSANIGFELRGVSADLETGRSYVVRVGNMDPVNEAGGVLKRLVHLGYLPFADVARLDTTDGRDELTCAVRRFQGDAGLETSGEIDDVTRSALVDRHGC
jgi:hypothetical protein